MADPSLTAAHRRALGALVAVHPVALELGRLFADAGQELYLVGGTIRDTLLGGSHGEDLDFATSAPPVETERLLRGWADAIWLTGARFGTVSATKGEAKLEITTFRSDVYEADSRHPEVTFGRDIEGDLARRDFTINAMAVSLPAHAFVDPFGGLRDLRDLILRTPVEPKQSFGDDPLRMVRLARFTATLGARPDDSVRAAASEMAPRLRTISAERLRDELDRLICGEQQARGFDLLCETGLADVFLPEVPALRMERDPSHHHKDVYRHSLAVVDACNRDDKVLRLAALLHDIGKPATREFHPGGKVSFHHHEVVGARMARKRLTELRYSKDEIEAISQLVFLHLRFHGYADGEWSDRAVRRYVHDAGPLLGRLNELSRADVTTRNQARARRLRGAMDDLEERIVRLRADEELDAIRPALDGHAIMSYLGLAPGPRVGEAWRMLKEARIDEGPMDEQRARELLDEWAEREGVGRSRPGS
jgi:poly(A) polymerase